jgi:aminobenzoyl-glutamate utilization protein B
MKPEKQRALDGIEALKELLWSMSDTLWDHPETGYHERFAAQLYCEKLEELGFQVERRLAGIETAFSGTYGSGGPVIGFLGEFDALPGLSQQAGCARQSPVTQGGPGHGCGHNLLGVGALAAALGVKQYLEENNLPGTVKFFGCPAEEGGSGKGFMARDGVFDGLDAAFCWHPGEVNSVATESTMANYQICYHFHGVASHAAMTPELGRSALDALELMNTGVQYLREHVPADTRIHYAITNAGGSAPGTVQAYAEGLYLLRARQLPQVKDLFQRVNNIAKGAALMTDTTVDIEFIKACSNSVINTELNQLMQRNLEQVPPPCFDQADLELAQQFRATLDKTSTYFDALAAEADSPEARERFQADAHSIIHAAPLPLARERQGFVSSDVGDVSWNCPVAQINGATLPAGVAMHSWQMVALGKSPLAKKGMLYAAKVMAASAIDALEDQSILQRAQDELRRRTGGQKYDSPIPPDVKPHIS